MENTIQKHEQEFNRVIYKYKDKKDAIQDIQSSNWIRKQGDDGEGMGGKQVAISTCKAGCV